MNQGHMHFKSSDCQRTGVGIDASVERIPGTRCFCRTACVFYMFASSTRPPSQSHGRPFLHVVPPGPLLYMSHRRIQCASSAPVTRPGLGDACSSVKEPFCFHRHHLRHLARPREPQRSRQGFRPSLGQLPHQERAVRRCGDHWESLGQLAPLVLKRTSRVLRTTKKLGSIRALGRIKSLALVNAALSES